MTDSNREKWPSVSFTRLGLLVGTPLVLLLGAGSLSWALDLKQWSVGDTMTATDLNSNFASVNTELARALMCPAGMVRVIDASAGSFCIDQQARPDDSSYNAQANCVTTTGRMCSVSEYVAGYASGQLNGATDDQGEWGSFVGMYAGTWGDGASCTGPTMWSYDFSMAGTPTRLNCVDADRTAANIDCATTGTSCAQYRCCR
jgi:hypothetical protein